MILVAGCSWACGEWPPTDSGVAQTVQHPGLSGFIAESGKEVVNLGIRGGSNLAVAQKINAWIDRNPDQNVEKIFVIQTDYARDCHMITDSDYDSIVDCNSLANLMIGRFYSKLTDISRRINGPVCLIGGVSDAPSREFVKENYPRVKMICQSWTNLLLRDNAQVENPVFSWYAAGAVPMVQRIKNKLSGYQLQAFLDLIDKGFERESEIFLCPEFFWPDGIHPNRHGHRKLYEFLVSMKHL